MHAHAKTFINFIQTPSTLQIVHPPFRASKYVNLTSSACRCTPQAERPLDLAHEATSAAAPRTDSSLESISPIQETGTRSPLDSIPPAKLKALRKLGLEMQDVIKLGRLGVGSGIVQQIKNRWKTSEVSLIIFLDYY